jgi:hypothetical protein
MKRLLINIISLVTMVFAGLILFGTACFADNTVKSINPSQDSSKSKQAEVAVRYERKTTWAETLALLRTAYLTACRNVDSQDTPPDFTKAISCLARDFPMEYHWFNQDNASNRINRYDHEEDYKHYFAPDRNNDLEKHIIAQALSQLNKERDASQQAFTVLAAENVPAGDIRWLNLYADVAAKRRAQRLAWTRANFPQILFIKRHPEKPSFFGYTEGQSDAQDESLYTPGASLCLLDLRDGGETVSVIAQDAKGVYRDLDVSYDGKRILYAYRSSFKEDDYHLYEMAMDTRKVRQITSGKGVADYEGCYLPNGDLIFSSTRCVQTVPCWKTEVSNLYTCDGDGRFLRRLGFDQVHTISPAVLNNGQVVFTRWDYNDRGQVYPHALFQMNPDGTGQTEYYGNNSWFPTTISHARPLPNSDKVLAVLMGHHTWQAGKLAVIDRTRGTQEASGVQLVAPVRETVAVRVDKYGQDEDLFRHPWPLSETEFITPYAFTACLAGSSRNRHTVRFLLCWVDSDGNREVLVADPSISCDNPIPLAPRKRPPIRPSLVDYTRDDGVFFMQDIYTGPGLAGIPRGTVKKLRVVGLEYRAAFIGQNSSGGPGGAGMVSTPVSAGYGTWDVKTILGEVDVNPDGSAMFKAPARIPLYFQAVDGEGCVVQTMRSWATLMPGETFSCVGCHEDKSITPVRTSAQAMRLGPQTLRPFQGLPVEGFSFVKHVQPILDRNCIQCHTGETGKPFSLTAKPWQDNRSKRFWSESYMNLVGAKREEGIRGQNNRPILNWISSKSVVSMLPPYSAGSAKSGMIRMLRNGEKGHDKVKMTAADLEILCAWIDLLVPYCGDYLEANAWNQAELDKYIHFQRKREALEEIERRNLEAFIYHSSGNRVHFPDPSPRYLQYLGTKTQP